MFQLSSVQARTCAAWPSPQMPDSSRVPPGATRAAMTGSNCVSVPGSGSGLGLGLQLRQRTCEDVGHHQAVGAALVLVVRVHALVART
eukprot:scaffold85655_cov54-Phaeocystis_antarctica.AAC.1